MTTTEIEVKLPKADLTKSYESIALTPTEITTDMTIVDALGNKNNSLVILVMAETAGKLIIKAGDHYPNRILGDCEVNCVQGFTAIRLQDISRFENKDDTVKLVGDGTLKGNIYVTAKRAGIMSVFDQNAEDNRG